MNMTLHAKKRAQQRGIPPLIDQWLDQYGREEYQNGGFTYLYFDKSSIRQMERDCGRRPIKALMQYLDAYKVVENETRAVITTGHRYKSVRRK